MVWTEAIAASGAATHPLAVRWRVQMASTARIVDVSGERDHELREALDQAAAEKEAGGIMQKDAHLIEAALATEPTVTSRDDRARGWFARTAGRILRLARIVWVNPGRTRGGADRVAEGRCEVGASEDSRRVRSSTP